MEISFDLSKNIPDFTTMIPLQKGSFTAEPTGYV